MFRRYGQLQTAVLCCLAIHVLAPVGMLLWVMPGFDLGGSAAEHRAAYIASSSWAWRLGWAPWQLCALSDLWVSVAVVRWVAARPARDGLRWAWFGVLATVAAVIPDQWGEWTLVTQHVDTARALASQRGDPSALLASESWALLMTGVCGNSGYVLMTIAWSAAIYRCSAGANGTAIAARRFGLLTGLVVVLFVASGYVAWRAASLTWT